MKRFDSTMTMDELDEKASQPLQWQNVLFLQINAINNLMNTQSPGLPNAVEALDSNLVYFRDPQYNTDIAEMNKNIEKMVKDFRGRDGQLPKDRLDTIEWYRAKTKFEIILKLIGRSGYYPIPLASFREE